MNGNRTTMCFAAAVACMWAAVPLSASEITNVKVSYDGEAAVPLFLADGTTLSIDVTVKGSDESPWVGATVISPDGNELDFMPQQAHTGKNLLGGQGTDVVTLHLQAPMASTQEFQITSAMWSENHYDEAPRLVVKLWGSPVRENECARAGSDGQVPCEYCRRNGYHMAGQVGSAAWRTLPYYRPAP